MLGKIATATRPSRRQFLTASAAAGAGLIIGFHLPRGGNKLAAAASTDGGVMPNAFVRIASDDTVTVLSKHIEFGQGVWTGLPTILAEELDADWDQVRVEHSPADAALYNNLHWGPVQGTGGSSAIANSYEQLRKAGATARALLVEAAAKRWGVPAGEITVEKGLVKHGGSNQSARFGELAEMAATLEVPAEVALKDPRDFTLIGKRIPRKDSHDKARGTAQFTIDMQLPGMLTAVIARPPVFGAQPKSVDDSAAKAVKGVTDVVTVPHGVAVVAESYWAAIKGREALEIDWDESTGETRGSAQIMAEYRELAKKPGTVARQDGDAEAAIAGLKPEQVTIHTLLAGGSFGRRATPDSDMVSEAVSVAKAIGGRAPVRLQWSREDDIQGGRYRPMYHHTLRAGLDDQGKLVGWQHRIVGQSIVKGTPFEGALVQNGIDQTSVEGANNNPYAVPNMTVDLHTTDVRVPVLWWRAVGSTHTAFSIEVFIDELARAAGRDPVEFRMEMLAEHLRHREVLRLAADKAGWGATMPAGQGRGIAVHESFNSYVAQVADVTVRDDGGITVDRVVCAVDCGVPVNPDVIKAQMEGGIGYGLGAILHDEITLDGGRVEQSNFHDYVPLRIEEMPSVEVHIVNSTAAPTGVGEPGTPPIGPAVANAVYDATGRRIRNLPFGEQNLRGA